MFCICANCACLNHIMSAEKGLATNNCENVLAPQKGNFCPAGNFRRAKTNATPERPSTNATTDVPGQGRFLFAE